MKAWLYYAFAAALLAAPVGWIVAGVLAARGEFIPAHYRRWYLSGNYIETAVVSALLVFVIVLLVGFARRSTKRSV